MKIIGLTGNIASGKSTVARMFEELGAEIIDADVIARSVVEPGETAWEEIVAEFGDDVLNPDRTVDRKKLGEIAFKDKLKREKLNTITHPKILNKIKQQIEFQQNNHADVTVIEAALIDEKSSLLKLVDALIVVDVDKETQLKRLLNRETISKNDAVSRINSQMPSSEKVKLADYVIHNSGTREETRTQVEEIWSKITL